VSAADNFREQTQLGWAQRLTTQALELFSAQSNPYGVARCHFLTGFCRRLNGDFAAAERSLADAYRLADEHSFVRFRVDTLMQIGEVFRCLDRLDEAIAALDEVIARATELDLVITRGFALSALGAARFQRGELDVAAACLEEARRVFEARRHSEGTALTLRRQAVVERHLSQAQAARADVTRSLDQYKHRHSPAGVAACLAARAWTSLSAGRRPASVCDALASQVDDGRQRFLLVKDPWVPGLLRKLAADAEHERLGEAAQVLVDESVERLLLKSTGGNPSAAARRRLVPRLRQRVQRHEEMAGEHRRPVLAAAA
jgi:tetratricopeptide (TPR) repeat protein